MVRGETLVAGEAVRDKGVVELRWNEGCLEVDGVEGADEGVVNEGHFGGGVGVGVCRASEAVGGGDQGHGGAGPVVFARGVRVGHDGYGRVRQVSVEPESSVDEAEKREEGCRQDCFQAQRNAEL